MVYALPILTVGNHLLMITFGLARGIQNFFCRKILNQQNCGIIKHFGMLNPEMEWVDA